MIYEQALITVHPGQEEGFSTAFFEQARAVILSAPGCLGAQLHQGIESPTSFLLLVSWESVEAHMEGFRNSPLFTRWREILGPFFVEPPRVQHFLPLA